MSESPKARAKRRLDEFIGEPELHFVLSVAVLISVATYVFVAAAALTVIDQYVVDMWFGYWTFIGTIVFIAISYPLMHWNVRSVEKSLGPFKFPGVLFTAAPLFALVYTVAGIVTLVWVYYKLLMERLERRRK